MSKLEAVTPERHQNKYWKRCDSFSFVGKNNLVPLVAAELINVIQDMPMAFIKNEEKFILMGVLSLIPGKNMFVNKQGKWIGSYIPSCFRGYPFSLARAEGRDDLILCVDEDSGQLSDTTGEPFFDKSAQLSKPIKDILSFLSQIEQNKTITDLAVSALADAGLVTEWNLKINTGEEEKPITGLYRIDETKLNTIDDEVFLKLRKAQSLPIAYAQILSMLNINVFEKLAKLRETVNKPVNKPGIPGLGNLLTNDDGVRWYGI